MKSIVLALLLTAGAAQVVDAAPKTIGKSPSVQRPVGKGARIFVDKAHPAHSDLQEADFKQLSDAGLNVVARLWTSNNSGKVINFEEYVRRASKNGIAVMQWDYGVITATEKDVATVNRFGKTTRYIAPLHPESWRQLTQAMVSYARLSKRNPNFKGVLLDFEIYGDNQTDGFCESYDDYTFTNFVKSIGRDVPNPLPAPEQRRHYLENMQWYQMYIAYHINETTRQTRRLRKTLDAINPNFQIGVYGWGFLTEPIIREMATPQAPALILDATTYARAVWDNAVGGYAADRPDRDALKWALDYTRTATRIAHQNYDNVYLLPGHYSQAPGPKDGTQYKFTAKQAFQSAAFGDGYWIWSDWITPEPWKDRKEWYDALVAALGQANAAVDAKDLAWASRQPDTVAARP